MRSLVGISARIDLRSCTDQFLGITELDEDRKVTILDSWVQPAEEDDLGLEKLSLGEANAQRARELIHSIGVVVHSTTVICQDRLIWIGMLFATFLTEYMSIGTLKYTATVPTFMGLFLGLPHDLQ